LEQDYKGLQREVSTLQNEAAKAKSEKEKLHKLVGLVEGEKDKLQKEMEIVSTPQKEAAKEKEELCKRVGLVEGEKDEMQKEMEVVSTLQKEAAKEKEELCKRVELIEGEKDKLQKEIEEHRSYIVSFDGNSSLASMISVITKDSGTIRADYPAYHFLTGLREKELAEIKRSQREIGVQTEPMKEADTPVNTHPEIQTETPPKVAINHPIIAETRGVLDDDAEDIQTLEVRRKEAAPPSQNGREGTDICDAESATTTRRRLAADEDFQTLEMRRKEAVPPSQNGREGRICDAESASTARKRSASAGGLLTPYPKKVHLAADDPTNPAVGRKSKAKKSKTKGFARKGLPTTLSDSKSWYWATKRLDIGEYPVLVKDLLSELSIATRNAIRDVPAASRT
jgi:hypothetical protein